MDTPMTDPEPEVRRSLYGSPDGEWLVMERAVTGLISPAEIMLSGTHRLVYLGAPCDVVSAVYGALVAKFAGTRQGGRGADVQQVMADMLGVGQQAVSRYVNTGTEPRLKPSGWSNLVRAYFGLREATVD
jgi:hypothetical protein